MKTTLGPPLFLRGAKALARIFRSAAKVGLPRCGGPARVQRAEQAGWTFRSPWTVTRGSAPLGRGDGAARRPYRATPVVLLAACVGLLALPTLLQAQSATNTPPARVSYQGFLTDGTGAALAPSTPANFTVDFKIYSVPNGGTVLWSERQVVTVDKGNFSVILGEGAAIPGENNANLAGVIANRADASERYIGLTVTIGGTPTVINPRLRLLTTPYAFLATTARSITDANGTNRVTWSPTANQTEVNGDLAVSGVLKGNGSGLTGISTASIGSIDAAKITSGVLDSNRIPVLLPAKIGGTLALSQIPVLDAARIPSLDAGKITSGVFASERIPSPLTGARSFTGSVGIGTNTPQTALHIASGAASTALRLGNFSAGGQQWQFESTGAGAAAGAGRLLVNNATDGKTVINIATNQVTINTNLNVQGALTVGASQLPLIANSGSDNLRIIRGTIRLTGTTATVLSGTGFTVTGGTPSANVTFTTRFGANTRPTVIATVGGIFLTAAAESTESSAVIRVFRYDGIIPTSADVNFVVFGTP